jgi:hypothetical protein
MGWMWDVVLGGRNKTVVRYQEAAILGDPVSSYRNRILTTILEREWLSSKPFCSIGNIAHNPFHFSF